MIHEGISGTVCSPVRVTYRGEKKKRYNENEKPKATSPEERVIQQQRMLLENVGETTSKVVSKVIDSVTPIMLRQAGGYPPQSQLPTYTDDEINKIADQLEKGR